MNGQKRYFLMECRLEERPNHKSSIGKNNEPVYLPHFSNRKKINYHHVHRSRFKLAACAESVKSYEIRLESLNHIPRPENCGPADPALKSRPFVREREKGRGKTEL